MLVKDDLGTRMKEFYEKPYKTKLTRRTPVAIRIDGKAFHTFTRGFAKPFDKVLMTAMQRTMEYLCKNIQGCVFGYTQSDEITLILVDYQKFTSSAWFDYEVQKICSISASMATMAFNKFFAQEVDNWGVETFGWEWYEGGTNDPDIVNSPEYRLSEVYSKAIDKGAMFDSRCFNIPKEEVANLIYWRQLDATRNSVQMVGQANFSHSELQGKTCNMIQDMLLTQKDINWNDFPVPCKRGTACRKVTREVNIAGTIDTISIWELDSNMPILKDDWNYVNDLIYIGEGM